MTMARIEEILASPAWNGILPRMARRGDPKVKRLAQVQLFSGCSKRDLARIAALSNEVEISQGTSLFIFHMKVLARYGAVSEAIY